MDLKILDEDISEKEQLHKNEHSTVFRVLTKNKKKSILKVDIEKAPSDYEKAVFLHEFRTLEKLKPYNNPHIPIPYKIGTYKGHLAMILEDIGGTALDKTLALSHPQGSEEDIFWKTLELETFFDVMIPVVKALRDIHDAGMTHKDVTHYNIITSNNHKTVQLIDYSITMEIPRFHQEVKINYIEGTWPFVSPEQTGRTAQPMDYRSDFYNLAITMNLLLTGRFAFMGNSPLDWCNLHSSKPIPDPRRYNPAVPDMLVSLINKCADKNPGNRYQSAYGLLQDLEVMKEMFLKQGSIVPFALGEKDFPIKFLLPDKIYGRDLEKKILVQNFKNLMLIDNQFVQEKKPKSK